MGTGDNKWLGALMLLIGVIFGVLIGLFFSAQLRPAPWYDHHAQKQTGNFTIVLGYGDVEIQEWHSSHGRNNNKKLADPLYRDGLVWTHRSKEVVNEAVLEITELLRGYTTKKERTRGRVDWMAEQVVAGDRSCLVTGGRTTERDAWGWRIMARIDPGPPSQKFYVLTITSPGPDGLEGTEDDIVARREFGHEKD